ncbi:unnamed protein product, partial [Durusdinium trenchii]
YGSGQTEKAQIAGADPDYRFDAFSAEVTFVLEAAQSQDPPTKGSGIGHVGEMVLDAERERERDGCVAGGQRDSGRIPERIKSLRARLVIKLATGLSFLDFVRLRMHCADLPDPPHLRTSHKTMGAALRTARRARQEALRVRKMSNSCWRELKQWDFAGADGWIAEAPLGAGRDESRDVLHALFMRCGKAGWKKLAPLTAPQDPLAILNAGLAVFGRTLAFFALGLDFFKKSMIPVREGEAKLGGQQLLLVAGQFGPLFGSHGRDGGGSAKLMVVLLGRQDVRPDVDEVVLSLSFIAGANGLQDLGA